MKDYGTVFVFYWKDGVADIVRAAGPAEGFNRLGYGNGAIASVDAVSRNSPLQRWDPLRKNWEAKEDHIRVEVDHSLDDEAKEAALKQAFTDAIGRAESATFDLPCKDQVLFSCRPAEYARIGNVICYTVGYGEYCEGGWDEEDPNDHHYMGTGTRFFHLNNKAAAIDAAVKYAMRGPMTREDVHLACTLEEIAARLDAGFRVD